MAVVGLYAGIGGFELGFQDAGLETVLLADRDEHCQAVLRKRFPGSTVCGDVADLDRLPAGTKIVTAGFPCQNLSMVGDKKGIRGKKSRDVDKMFDLLARSGEPTLAIENVYFMLHLKRGAAMSSLVRRLEDLGYAWAYRVVNTLAFGLPQRRRRVFLVASQEADPRDILFADNEPAAEAGRPSIDQPLGFYWTEGRKGVGIAVDAIPPLKVASGLGIPSTPAVLFPDGQVLTPGIEACERLQGFPTGWTDGDFTERHSPRWSMVGNAVSVPAAAWLAGRIKTPGSMQDLPTMRLRRGDPWPTAAFGSQGERHKVNASEDPVHYAAPSIAAFRDDSWRPLSPRALRGFIRRVNEGGLRLPVGFLDRLSTALANVSQSGAEQPSEMAF